MSLFPWSGSLAHSFIWIFNPAGISVLRINIKYFPLSCYFWAFCFKLRVLVFLCTICTRILLFWASFCRRGSVYCCVGIVTVREQYVFTRDVPSLRRSIPVNSYSAELWEFYSTFAQKIHSVVRYTGWYDHTSTAQSELTWDFGLWDWSRAKASCCFILKSWVKHRGKNKIMLKNTRNLGRKDRSYSDFGPVKLDSVLFEGPMPKQQTRVILRLFKRAGDREPVLPEALPKPQVEADADVRSCWDCLVCYVIDNPCDTIPVPSTALLEFSTGFGENWLRSCVCLMC